MINNVLGLINLGEKEQYVQELTEVRPLAAVPFGGRYRLIDFVLSNMVNSGIDTIGIVLKDKFRSLNDHIGPGKHWDLDRKTGGLRMLYPELEEGTLRSSLGDIPILQSNLRYFLTTPKDHILLTRSNYVANIDFEQAIQSHESKRNDITILTRGVKNGRNRTDLLGLEIVTREGDKISIGRNLGSQEEFEISIEMYVLRKEVFSEILIDAIEEGKTPYFKEALQKKLSSYKTDTCIISDDILPINSIQSYYNASMQLLDPEYARYLFYRHGKIYTKVKDAPSTLYLDGSDVKNSLIANGCIIRGTVENSVLFRGVTIEEGAVVRNSIIFQDGVVGRESQINNCILDKNVEIADRKILMGDGGVPYVIKKGVHIR